MYQSIKKKNGTAELALTSDLYPQFQDKLEFEKQNGIAERALTAA